MNMDFHVHGLLSKRKDFNEEFFMNEIYFSKVNGLNAIVLCEHFNAKDFLVIYEFLDRKSTRLNSSHSAKSRMPSSA